MRGFPDYYQGTQITNYAHGTLESLQGIPGGTVSLAPWPMANLALYQPITLQERAIIEGFFFLVGATGGNIDAGLFDLAFNLLASLGGVALVANTGTAVPFPAGFMSAGPGQFWIGVSSDHNLIDLLCYELAPGVNTFFGGLECGSQYPLRNLPTFTGNNSRNYIPIVNMAVGPGAGA